MAGITPGIEKTNVLVVVGMNESPTRAGHGRYRTSRTVRISFFMKLPSVHISLSLGRWEGGRNLPAPGHASLQGPFTDKPPAYPRILASGIVASSPPTGLLISRMRGRFAPSCILDSGRKRRGKTSSARPSHPCLVYGTALCRRVQGVSPRQEDPATKPAEKNCRRRSMLRCPSPRTRGPPSSIFPSR